MLSRWQTELEGKAWNSLFWKNTQAPDEEGDICFRPYEAIAYAIIAGGFYMGIIYEEKSRQFHLYNDKISYIMTCLPNGQMGQLYYGKRIRHRESFGHLLEFAHRDMAPCVYEDDTTFSLEHIKQEYPGFGTGEAGSVLLYTKATSYKEESRNCRACQPLMWSRMRRRGP